MSLDQGKLANIDRRIFAELSHHRGTQAVKVPVSDAMWSAWRRYCYALGLTMGEGIAGLIDQELVTVVDETNVRGDVLARRAEERAAARERAVGALEQRLRNWERQLGVREAELRDLEERMRTPPLHVPLSNGASRKVGRNEGCPCSSGLKYKHCHGLPSGRYPRG